MTELIQHSLAVALIPPQTRTDTDIAPRWTLKRLVNWVKEKYQISCCRETVRTALKSLGFSWKKWRKLLNKADPAEREAFVAKLKEPLEAATQGSKQLVYIDEAHVHLDTDEGYGWTVKGSRAWISSSSPGLAKVSFYGVYLYNQGQVRIFPYDKANGENTIDVLNKIKRLLPNDSDITVLWDNVSYHHRLDVRETARTLNITLLPLPTYSPDFMPVEHLWQWLREEVTYHACYNHKEALITQVERFETSINASPHDIADRLWTKTSLDPEQEKLRFSS